MQRSWRQQGWKPFCTLNSRVLFCFDPHVYTQCSQILVLNSNMKQKYFQNFNNFKIFVIPIMGVPKRQEPYSKGAAIHMLPGFLAWGYGAIIYASAWSLGLEIGATVHNMRGPLAWGYGA